MGANFYNPDEDQVKAFMEAFEKASALEDMTSKLEAKAAQEGYTERVSEVHTAETEEELKEFLRKLRKDFQAAAKKEITGEDDNSG